MTHLLYIHVHVFSSGNDSYLIPYSYRPVPLTVLLDEALMSFPLPKAVSCVHIPDSIEADKDVVLMYARGSSQELIISCN